MRALGKYMYVRDSQPSASGLTSIWSILGRGDGVLGQVRWFGRWRCYAFHPEPHTVFNAECMEELMNFCATETKYQRRRKK